MVLKKLKKLAKECRNTGGPVLSTLSMYLDHVGAYLECDDQDGARVAELGAALSNVDLTAVAAAQIALAAVEQTLPCETKAESKKQKKKKKKEEKVTAEECAAEPLAAEGDEPAPVEEKKNKKDKKRKHKGK